MADLLPWDQQPGESSLWFSRFETYLKMGVVRSFMGAHEKWLREQGKYNAAEKAKQVPGQWQVKAKEFAWKNRAEAWDQEERRQQRAWEDQKLQELKKEELRLAFLLLEEGRKMLEWPLVEKTISEDGKTIIFKPAGWSKSTVERYLKAGSELARRSVGAPLSGEIQHATAQDSEEHDDQRELEDIEWLRDAMPEMVVDVPTE